VLAATARVTRDLDVAEECVQEAYVSALDAWARDGVPDKPGAWLTVAARRNALNLVRRAATLQSKLPLLLEPEAEEMPEDETIPDDRLRLVFICCHPALSREAQVALTLRLVCGVATPDIADAFLVPEPTMAARLTRAKKKIAAARIPYAVPEPQELPERVDAVLTVIHLLATTGHTAPRGEALQRLDLLERALDLARMLVALLPREPEARGLLALVLILHARRETRGELLADQDRSSWDRAEIAEADALVRGVLAGAPAGRFTLQAAIAALHAQAETAAQTDWPQIAALYGVLSRIHPSPVVELNRAAAVAMADGLEQGLALVDRLAGELASYHLFHAARADLLRRLGRCAEAAAAYKQALALAGNEAERQYLVKRLHEVTRDLHSEP
jgi:RNA polymerase sigma-70 factor, ECF subfamily